MTAVITHCFCLRFRKVCEELGERLQEPTGGAFLLRASTATMSHRLFSLPTFPKLPSKCFPYKARPCSEARTCPKGFREREGNLLQSSLGFQR